MIEWPIIGPAAEHYQRPSEKSSGSVRALAGRRTDGRTAARNGGPFPRGSPVSFSAGAAGARVGPAASPPGGNGKGGRTIEGVHPGSSHLVHVAELVPGVLLDAWWRTWRARLGSLLRWWGRYPGGPGPAGDRPTWGMLEAYFAHLETPGRTFGRSPGARHPGGRRRSPVLEAHTDLDAFAKGGQGKNPVPM